MKAQRLRTRLFSRQVNLPLQPLAWLLVLALGSGHGYAADRSLHLHAASHATSSARLAAAEPRRSVRHGKAVEATPHRASPHSTTPHPQHNSEKSAKAAAPSGKTRAHVPGRRQRQAQEVDVPVTLHRASTHGSKARESKADRRRDLAEDARAMKYAGRNGIASHNDRAFSSAHSYTVAHGYSIARSYPAHGYSPERINSPERTDSPESGYNSEPKYSTGRIAHSENTDVVPERPAEALPLHNPKIHHLVGAPASTPAEQSYVEGTPSQQSAKMAARVDAALRKPHPFASGQSHPEDDSDVLIGDAITTATPYRRNSLAPALAVPETEPIVSSATATSAPLPQPRVVTGFGAEVAPASQYAARSPQQIVPANNLAAATSSGAAVRALADDAVQPMVLPIYTRSGELMMPAPLKGSHDILVHQNVMADHDGLERIQNDRQLDRLRAQHMLVSFPEMAGLRVNESLPANRRYARPWTVKFAADVARAFYAQFSEPLIVSSAVRTVAYQLRLERVNGNAAAVSGEGASPHLTGQAIDLAKHSMSSEEIAWMRTYLAQFIDAGKIDVEEEFQQACFHISVYRAYMPAEKRVTAPRTQVAQLRAEPRTAAVRDENDSNER